MTLDTYYQTFDRKTLSYQILIGGVPLTDFVSVTYSHGIQKVPSASIRIRGPLPASVVFNAPVEITLGFWGATVPAFTGTVLHPDNSDATGITIECQGMSACLDNAYHKVIVSIDGSRTVPELIEDLLALSGALHYSVNMPDWTAGAVVPQTLSFQTYGEAITKLAEVNGGRWYETPAGTIKVEPKDAIPALTAWRAYFSMTLTGLTEAYPAGIVAGRPRLRRCGQVRRAREVKNQVWVRGAVLTNTNPDGSETSVTLEERAYAPSPWVLNPDGSQAYNDELYSNEIIDDAVVAGLEAGRRVAVKNRLLTQVDVAIDGDPQVQAGVTVQIEDPAYSAVTGNWFVEAITTTLSVNHFETTLSLLGGPEAGGDINVAPFANFVYAIEHEVMGDRPWDIVTLDGRLSVDPDGTIVRWCWSDNQTPMKASGCGEVFTTRVDPTGIVPPWEVTLTVEDNDGGTDDLMLTIPYESTEADVWIPSIFSALDVAASVSPDGGLTWNDQVIAGKSVISTSAKPADGVNFGIGVFGTADGCIYRTTNFCATAPTLVQAALASPIEHLWWDINVTTRVWGVTQNGKVLWSWDDGLHWAVYDDLAVIFGLASIRLSRIATPVAGGLWIFGGTGTGWPLICWDAGLTHSWVGADLAGGELATDLAASGYPTDLYVAHAASRGDVLAIILNSATHAPAVYTGDALGAGTTWKRALGDAGALAKTRGKWIDLDLTVGHYVLGFDDAATYQMDVAAGVGTITAAPATFGTNKGNYCQGLHWYENIDGAYLVAAEAISGSAAGFIYKTWDRFGTVALVRPATGFSAAPALAKAKMIAFGAPTLGSPGRVLFAARLPSGKKFAAWRTGYGNWTTKVFDTELGTLVNGLRVRALTADLWFIFSHGAYCDPGSRIVRTKNGSAAVPTWDSVTTPKAGDDYWIDFAIDAGGRVWGVTCDIVTTGHVVKIWYSDDQGDTWTLSSTTTGTAGSPLNAETLACHPSNQNIIALRSNKGIVGRKISLNYTLTRGSSWVGNISAAGVLYDAWVANTGLKVCDNNRLIMWTYHSGGNSHIETSDDWGATPWTDRKMWNAYGASNRVLGAANPSGSKAFAFLADPGGPDDHSVWWSQDYDITWVRFDNQPLGDEESGIAYDPVDDALYAFTDNNRTSNTLLVSKMMPVAQDGSWIDFSDTLLPIGADTHYVSEWSDQIAAIPR